MQTYEEFLFDAYDEAREVLLQTLIDFGIHWHGRGTCRIEKKQKIAFVLTWKRMYEEANNGVPIEAAFPDESEMATSAAINRVGTKNQSAF